MKLSVIIPARNEAYLQNTIDDILVHSGIDDMEVIVGLDEYWPDPPIKEDSRVVIYHSGERIGMRPMINRLVSMARGEYVMKTDAHCSFDDGYCSKLIETCEKKSTVLGIRYELNAEAWERKERTNCDFRYLSNPAVDTLGGLRGLPWHEYKQRTKGMDVAESMSLSGSGWLMRKKQFENWGGLDERHGTFGQEGCEIACMTWLSGGRLLIDRRTWYAHWNRGKAPYALSTKHRQKSIDHSIWLWMGNNWPLAKYSFEWLIDRFKPVPGWDGYSMPTPFKAPKQGTLFKGCRAPYKDEETDIRMDKLWEKRLEIADLSKKKRLFVLYDAYKDLGERILASENYEIDKTPYWEYLRSFFCKCPNPTEKELSRIEKQFKSGVSLFKDMRDNGLRVPLEFYAHHGRLYLFRGYRRFVAAHVLGFERIPVMIYKTKRIAKSVPARLKSPPRKRSIVELGERQFMKHLGKATDKYWTHCYLPIYDYLFDGLRKKKIKLLEVGVARGASHALWRDAFPKGHIFGIDKDISVGDEFLKDLDRVTLFQGKQQDIDFLEKTVVPNGPFDIVIDDCGHNPTNQWITFKALFPHVKPFGFYVMEDCYTSFKNVNDTNASVPNVPMELTRFVRDIYEGYTIASVQFYYNICVVQKGIEK